MKKQILLFIILTGVLLLLPYATVKADLHSTPFKQFEGATYRVLLSGEMINVSNSSVYTFDNRLPSDAILDKLNRVNNNNLQGSRTQRLYAELCNNNSHLKGYSAFDNTLPSEETYESMYSDSRDRRTQRAVGNGGTDTGTGGNNDSGETRNDAPVGNGLSLLLLFTTLYILFIHLEKKQLYSQKKLL